MPRASQAGNALAWLVRCQAIPIDAIAVNKRSLPTMAGVFMSSSVQEAGFLFRSAFPTELTCSSRQPQAGVEFTFSPAQATARNAPVRCASGPVQVENPSQVRTTSNVPDVLGVPEWPLE